MRVALPRPLNGWRKFLGEVGTIVLGVLLALGAQEVAQGIHWRSQVRETRQALNAELARDLASFDYRLSQRKCVAQRLDELDIWARSIRNRSPLALKRPVTTPPSFAIRSAVWGVTDGEVASHMPIWAKLGYAALYDGMKNFEQLTEGEYTSWTTVAEYEKSKFLDDADQRKIEAALKDLRFTNEILAAFNVPFTEHAVKLGIEPENNLEKNAEPMVARLNQNLCLPLL